MSPSFPREEFAGRVAKTRAAMAEAGADVLLVDHAEFLAWLENERLRDEGLVIADLAEARIQNAERRAKQLACELAVACAKIEGLTRRDDVTGDSATVLQLSDRDALDRH